MVAKSKAASPELCKLSLSTDTGVVEVDASTDPSAVAETAADAGAVVAEFVMLMYKHCKMP